eukprot:scaffold219240_cov29-Tisochrysis_lutea.AAC.3
MAAANRLKPPRRRPALSITGALIFGVERLTLSGRFLGGVIPSTARIRSASRLKLADPLARACVHTQGGSGGFPVRPVGARSVATPKDGHTLAEQQSH